MGEVSEFCENKCVRLCNGVSEMIGNLVVGKNSVHESITLPIDTLVLNLTSKKKMMEFLVIMQRYKKSSKICNYLSVYPANII